MASRTRPVDASATRVWIGSRSSGGDQREVADTGKGQVERPRDRRRGERQDIDLAAQLLEPLLCRDAETLLLVHDDHAQVAESDVLAEQAVRTDDEVDGTGGQAVDSRLLLAGRDEARQQPHRHRVGREALLERGVVLGSQDGRRHENGDLLAALYRLEHAPQRDLGLAVANVAHDQAVHRLAGFHVELDLGRGPELVERFLVRERRLDFLLPGRVGRVGEAGGSGPSGVDLEQLFGEVGDGALDPLLGPEPLGPAQLGQRGVLAARVAADAVDLLHGQEDLVCAGEAQLQVVALIAGGAAAKHPLVAGDAVIDVDDEVALGQPLQNVARHDPAKRLGPPDANGAEQLAISHEHQAIRAFGETAVEAAPDESPSALRRSVGQVVGDGGRKSLLAQQFGQPRSLVGCQHDPTAVGGPGPHRFGEAGRPGRRQRRLAPPEDVPHRRATTRRRRSLRLPRQFEGATAEQAALPLPRTQVRLGPLPGEIACGHQLGAALLSLAPQEIGRVGDVAGFVEDEERARWQVIEPRGGAQNGGPNLGRVACLQSAGSGGDVMDVTRVRSQLSGSGTDRVFEAGHVRGEPVRKLRTVPRKTGHSLADLGHSPGRDEELTGGEQDHFLHGPEAALVCWVEDAHRVDLVAEQLDPDGQRGGRWKHVDEAASAGEFTAAGHFEDRVVAEAEEVVEQFVLMDAGPDTQPARLGRQLLRVDGVLQESLDARHQDAGAAGTPRRQRRHAGRGLVANQLAAFVGEGGPGLQHRDGFRVAQPGLQFLGHTIANLRVPSHPAKPLPRDRGCA
jgi:hypothetical protein